jgi:hypothetical protein
MIFLFIILTSFTQNSYEYISSSVNHGELTNNPTIFISVNDELELISSEEKYWFFYNPVLKEYNNLVEGANHLEEIEYKTALFSNKKTNRIEFNKLNPGTYYIGVLSQPESIQIVSSAPIHLTNTNIIQIVVRANDSYLGFLTEQLGLPFILPPKMLGMYGHQTDLRIGTDCAELAIYGKRRMGYNIPYCGPNGIFKYLDKTNIVSEGTIIHFGYQVSIVYEDRGKIGYLDGEDLIIHAFQDKVKIERLEDTELKNNEFKLYNWKK